MTQLTQKYLWSALSAPSALRTKTPKKKKMKRKYNLKFKMCQRNALQIVFICLLISQLVPNLSV